MPWEAIITRGGFYGCCLALYLRRDVLRVVVLEREDDLPLRASRRNQARIHAGFHYPHSLTTALRSLLNLNSLFEVKTILARNEGDDGRPIFFAQPPGDAGAFYCLGP
jgi:glycine/D-amino acid oxidase-like deaminating enzyme